ncbi:hypothetical protein QJQ45_017432 [Haematococcus lacustris]|nr:hypothetical protein QJQ45_017432 [Haematococcus lacustris]
MMWYPVVALCKPPQAPCSSQAATQPAASEPGPSTPTPAKRSKRTKAEQAAKPTQPTKGKGKAKGKAAKAKPAPHPGRRPLELCWWPEQAALPAKVVQRAALRMDEWQSHPGVWDPHCTWHQFDQDIQAMAEGSPCSTGLRLHLEVYFLACPTSNAPVESLLQMLKHEAGRFMELPALLEHMSLHTHRSILNNIVVQDFTLQLPKLRAAVRLHEVAAAVARAPATAARNATAAACSAGVVVVNVGDHASHSSGW